MSRWELKEVSWYGKISYMVIDKEHKENSYETPDYYRAVAFKVAMDSYDKTRKLDQELIVSSDKGWWA